MTTSWTNIAQGFHYCFQHKGTRFSQAGKPLWTELLYKINFPLDHQTRWEELSSQVVNLPGAVPLMKPCSRRIAPPLTFMFGCFTRKQVYIWCTKGIICILASQVCWLLSDIPKLYAKAPGICPHLINQWLLFHICILSNIDYQGLSKQSRESVRIVSICVLHKYKWMLIQTDL